MAMRWDKARYDRIEARSRREDAHRVELTDKQIEDFIRRRNAIDAKAGRRKEKKPKPKMASGGMEWSPWRRFERNGICGWERDGRKP